MTKPVRIQRKRAKGWRLPENTIVVTRPTKWGNPFSAVKLGAEEAVRLYKNWLEVSLPGQAIAEEARNELRGKNLACYCHPGRACHADVLLKIANPTSISEGATGK